MGDRTALTKAVTFGEVGKISPKAPPKAGPIAGLDKIRTGSARNTAKDYTNPKKWKFGN